MLYNVGVKFFVECYVMCFSYFLECYEMFFLSKKKMCDILKICDFFILVVGVCVFFENN